MDIEKLVASQHEYFAKGETLDIKFRIKALKKLRDTMMSMENEINEALMADLGKSAFETYMCEIGMTLSELNFMLKHIKKWSKPRKVLSPLAQFPAKSYTVRDPHGVVLIMSPWNYPFMLAMEPVVGAIACGNCVVIKPSAYSPATSAVIKKLIEKCFKPEYVAVVEGGRAENKALLDQKYDYIFFTGGVTVGKEVMRKAAENLTPVTLELGGKSPVIIDKTCKIKTSAARLASGKILNSGQTCVAPDYVLIDKSIEAKFVEELKKQFDKQLKANALDNPEYVHMINQKHFDRVCGLIDEKKVTYGGKSNPENLRIEPTIMQNVTPEDAVMQEEIFGPILPVIGYDTIYEAINFVNSRPHPLACYLFTQDKKLQKRVLREVPFGGGCINDTIMHIATSRMPFGGVGQSGMGSYHGKKSFDTFTHEKSVIKKYVWLDMPVRYIPATKLKNKLLRIFLK